MTDLTIGGTAPDFTLPRNGEGTVTLSKLQGKAVILYFYPKDDTSGCTAEAIDFSALGGEFEAANAVVIGISPDSVKSHDKFAAKHALSVMLAADEEKKVVEAYGVWKEKSMYGKKYMGVERTTFLIAPDGKIAEVWNKVKVAGHAQAVLEAVKKL
ncbi:MULTISPECIES: thioredoxin-dependent thiol peroxidase [Agrobacterium]|jgi:peroxiredoxin Q/BCP|uniref:thioredoxin-dependent peroxiredoxin n=4 Tax=Agrobacterium tumefaciens complex TaxID=1183400 RepID=A0AAW8LQB4_AGRTU|nr:MULTISPECIES: thioredoxin-dependent thiol peroxidase [Agrobacterium]MCP2134430.1 peroxiredoxin Q/BCP [Rhizobium sp. SLBN-94]TGE80283.1 thioredoxin-dependent thiol peroxidase [Rhizobium sp. SEMIA 439]AYM05732.1 bacterioferritin comigratory protein [Agrobacterium tumefaciens]AYM81360.1 bacterioferritin comigratory protein [Agrobacterium tumefaciens]EHH04254.1 bacterioferritin comigratory protein [Agrobacterium tumefaciens CCNWGS0286]